ncbi:MAG: sigma-70 family RNA polymerase sigma factor [Bacteroidota bacterium]
MRLLSAHMDGKVIEELHQRYASKLTSFSARMLMNRTVAEDLVQEVFIKIIEKPNAFDTAQKFSTWIFTIAHNLCLNAIRNEQNRDRLLNEHYEVQEQFIQHSTIDVKLIKEKMNMIFKELSEKEKAVFIFRFEHELNLKEIASILSIPEGSVKSCLFYMLKKLSDQLSPLTNTP